MTEQPVPTVAAIFAHPDDEILGCGGAMAWHAAQEHPVHILILATGLAARGEAAPAALQHLRDQARAASRAVGARSIEFADFPDNAMDSGPLLPVVQRVERFLEHHRPSHLYTHHAGDLNIDHGMVHQAVLTAARPVPGRGLLSVTGTLEILACEVNSATEWGLPSGAPFVPTDFLDISDHLAAKLTALACYESELRDWPHPRSQEGVRTQATWRGIQSGLGVAEAFMMVRRIRGAPQKN